MAEDMWKDYQRVLSKREMLDEIDEDSEQELFEYDEWDGEEDYQNYVQILSKIHHTFELNPNTILILHTTDSIEGKKMTDIHDGHENIMFYSERAV